MLKCIHTADWHVCDKNIEEARKCLLFLVETVRAERPDITIIAGDIFDSRNVKLESLASRLVFEVISEIAGVSPVVAILGTASHDGESTLALKYIKARYPVHVSGIPEQLYLAEGDLNSDPTKLFAPGQAPIEAVISMCPAPTKQYFQSAPGSSIDSTNKEIASTMSAIFAGFGAKAQEYDCPHILAGHFTIGGAFISDNQQLLGVDVEMSTDQLGLSNTQLNCLGHIHYCQKLGDKTFYSGNLFQADTGEAGQRKGFWIHEISASGLQKSTFINTPTRQLLKISHDFTESPGDFCIHITPEKLELIKGAIVKVELTVYEDEISRINMPDLELRMVDAKEFNVKIIRTPRVNVRSADLLKMRTLREKVVEWGRLRGETVPESILKKADDLESMESDDVVKSVSK